MPSAEGQVQTERSSRYLVQLCRHAAAMDATQGHRVRTDVGGDALARRDVRLRAQWSNTSGTVTFAPWGRCTLQASPEALMLRVEATDEDNLRRLQDVITRNLERFGRREHLTVEWQQPVAPAARLGDADPADLPGPGEAAQTAPASRGRRTTMVLATVGVVGVALSVAMHSGLGAAALAASRVWGWTAMGLVVVPVVVILGHALAPMTVLGLRPLAARRKRSPHPLRAERQDPSRST